MMKVYEGKDLTGLHDTLMVKSFCVRRIFPVGFHGETCQVCLLEGML